MILLRLWKSVEQKWLILQDSADFITVDFNVAICDKENGGELISEVHSFS